MGIVFVYVGPVDDGEQAIAKLREATNPLVDIVQPMPYTAVQQMLDAGNPDGIREYFKVDWLSALSDETIDLIVEQAENLPSPFGQLILAPMGGAVARTDSSKMALNMQDAPWMYFCLSMWMDPTEDDRNRDWARGFAAAMEEFGVGATYPNFIEPDEGNPRLRQSFGPEKYDRLAALKREWDPDNLFRLNQNIEPAA
jgi:FAD/FMN-containing dehydrogenase